MFENIHNGAKVGIILTIIAIAGMGICYVLKTIVPDFVMYLFFVGIIFTSISNLSKVRKRK